MQMRLATFEDWRLLLQWRNDPVTRSNSLNTEEVDEECHKIWLKQTLSSTRRKLFIFEDNGVGVGTARADIDDDQVELSWTVAPQMRSKGYGKKIVMAALQVFDKPIIARIKADNIGSLKIAESVGMVLDNEVDGVMVWKFTRDRAKD